jgi:hypothetical protein
MPNLYLSALGNHWMATDGALTGSIGPGLFTLPVNEGEFHGLILPMESAFAKAAIYQVRQRSSFVSSPNTMLA